MCLRSNSRNRAIVNEKPRTARCICINLHEVSSIVGPQRIVVAQGFVWWFKRSEEMSVNAQTSKEASRRTRLQCSSYGVFLIVYTSWERCVW
ncbi:hypothetical protein AVEN_55873-1 [Araneus ventricosus]|uniref:Uncharacterized protein n=1 Tax=Araneus ventricosus TaxID=182803 RepID=A0A4Y2GSX8_ARAVE|nr:hypothetical protein AVEN_55873-1 [Araneus ventricosus]